jgi:hypothetical protein
MGKPAVNNRGITALMVNIRAAGMAAITMQAVNHPVIRHDPAMPHDPVVADISDRDNTMATATVE